jgi:acetyl esterase/lipase
METTYEKARREDEEYRKGIDELATWGEKLRLVSGTPDLVSLFYPGNDVLLVNIHGGGFAFKHPADNDAYCHYINQTYVVSVLNCDISSSVKWGYPVQLLEIDSQVRAILRERPGHKKIILAGHSSGANLALATAMRWKREKSPIQADALILDYPFLDLTKKGADRPTYEGAWPDSLIDDWVDLYAPSKAMRKDPLVSPLLMDKKEAKGLPPSIIASPANDRLKDDAAALSSLLDSARVKHRLLTVNERHGFIERNMKNCYLLPNEPAVTKTKAVVDQELIYTLTLK